MTRPRIAIRADASTRIGIGHVRRCLALAAALRDFGADVILVTRDLGIDTIPIAGVAGVETIVLPGPTGRFAPGPGEPDHAAWAEVDCARDADESVAALAGAGTSAFVIDHYAFDARWHERVRAALGCRLVAIDDLGDRPLAADLIVDHNLSADPRMKYRRSLRNSVNLLSGPRFALIDPGYATAARYGFSPVVRSVGIFMGGSDAVNASALALDAVNRAGLDVDVELVSTRANPFLERLRDRAARNPRLSLSIDLPDLAAFFARHDLQIGAGGGASWERCCIGAPTLALVVAANQKQVLEPLHATGAVAMVEEDANDEATVARALAALAHDGERRRELSLRARALVDGEGARRVAREVMSL